jgi:GTP-sensing pleiotropic transcriptional regulator CodY
MKEQGVPTLFDIMKKNPEMTYNEAVKVQEDIKLRNEESAAAIKEAGACITSGMKRDRKATDKMKSSIREDRGPLDLTRRVEELQDRVKELDTSLSIALEINESHQRYNGKLQTRVTELEEDNKKLAHQVEDLKLNHVRKAGL